MKTLNDHAKAIERIGRKRVQDHFSVSRQTLHTWRTTGIPVRYHASVRLLAQLHGVSARELDE